MIWSVNDINTPGSSHSWPKPVVPRLLWGMEFKGIFYWVLYQTSLFWHQISVNKGVSNLLCFIICWQEKFHHYKWAFIISNSQFMNSITIVNQRTTWNKLIGVLFLIMIYPLKKCDVLLFWIQFCYLLKTSCPKM